MKTHRVSVGDLADLCRGGDINFRFSPRSRAMEGIRGHQTVQKSRGDAYLPEYAVNASVISDDTALEVSGRIDGVFHDASRCVFVIDEIKTVRVALKDIPASVMAGYWHQVLLYAHLLSSELDQSELVVRLCFFHLEESSEEIIERLVRREDLAQLFADTTLYYLEHLKRREQWLAERAQSIASLPFPYDTFRAGQRDLSVAVFRALEQGQHLVLEAPTGLGKTIGTLFPAIRRLEQGDVRRILYLSARTSTQEQVREAVRHLAGTGARIGSVVLTAKDKICFSPGEPCHPDHCRFARGYYDKLPNVLERVLASDRDFSRERIEQIADQHEVCPFELGLDLAGESDVIIADYNYVFDPVVYLRRFFDGQDADSIALVDEAHNLVDRGRDMFSAELYKERFLELARLMSGRAASLVKASRAVNQAILDYRRAHRIELDEQGHIVSSELPQSILMTLRRFCEAAEEELRVERDGDLTGNREILLQVYFEALRFLRTSEWFDDSYLFLFSRTGKQHGLKLYCVDPSVRLGEVFDRLVASVSFSATLRPSRYFRQMMGVPDDSRWYRLPSPFPPENLHVSVAPFIDTSYRGRDHSLGDLVRVIYEVISAKTGNYLVFFPSYDYLEKARYVFQSTFPESPLLIQERGMSDEDRQTFLSSYESEGDVCGFAVMGGAFSEGIDLKGARLIGVIVVGVGLPQVGVERDLIRDHFPESGFEYAYQYPGLIRVLQTAGRLIRDQNDRGVLCLVDRRYAQSRYLDLLPETWAPRLHRQVDDLREGINGFWRSREAIAGKDIIQSFPKS